MTRPQDNGVVPFPRSLEAAQRRAARQHDQIQAPASDPLIDPPGWRLLSAFLIGVLVLSLIGLAAVLLIALPIWAACTILSALFVRVEP